MSMAWVAAGTALLGAGASVHSANQNRRAANAAAARNDDLARLQFEEDKRRYDLNRADQERWGMMQIQGEEEMDRRNRADKEKAYQRGAALNKGNVDRGEQAGAQLQYLMGLSDKGTGEKGYLARNFTNADFVKDPGYEFRMAEGERGQNNSLAAQGGLLSGAAMKALERYRQGFASQEYDKAYARFTNDQQSQYSRLAGIQTAGQNAINSTNGLGTTVQGSAGNGAAGVAAGLANASNQFGQATNNYYNNLMNNNIAKANTQAAYNNGISQSVVNGLNTAYNGWQQNQLMQQLQMRNNIPSNYYYGNSGGYDNLQF